MTESTRRMAALTMVERAEQRARQAAVDLDAALVRLAGTENEPDQPRKNSVIKFQVQFSTTGDVYTYVAYRAPTGDWYRTGDKTVYTWETLLDFMYRDITSKRLGVGFFLFSGKSGHWVGRQP